MKHFPKALEIGRAKRLQSGHDVDIWAMGAMLQDAEKVAARLSEHGISAGVVNARFAKPLDQKLLKSSAHACKLIVTMEDHVITGGFGSCVVDSLQDVDVSCPVLKIGWPDEFVEHGSSVRSLREAYGLNNDAITERIVERLKQLDSSKVDVSK